MTRSAAQDRGLFEEGRERRGERLAQYTADLDRARLEHDAELKSLEDQGYVIKRRWADPALCAKVAADFAALSQTGKNLQPPWLVCAEQPARVPAKDISKGEAHLRGLTNNLQIQEPLLVFPELVEIALDEEILDLAGAYLGCLPALGFAKVVKTLVNDLPAYDTQLFHIDGNSETMLKGFLLLSDVDAGNGAHSFVTGSHRDRRLDLAAQDRWTLEEVTYAYGNERIVRHLGAMGDFVVEDNSGVHRGGTPETEDRLMAIFNYVVHREYGGGGATVKIDRRVFDRLSPKQRAAAELLDVTE